MHRAISQYVVNVKKATEKLLYDCEFPREIIEIKLNYCSQTKQFVKVIWT